MATVDDDGTLDMPTISHVTRLEPGGNDQFAARCACGWKSADLPTRQHARVAGWLHCRKMAGPPQGKRDPSDP